MTSADSPANGSLQSIRPVLRWAGSKRRMIPAILALCPSNYVRYIEPFAGSASVFVALRPDRAVLSDINVDLITTYRAIRRNPAAVARQARRWPSDSPTYYRIRALNPKSLTPVGRAARFVYLNRYCFNGVYRENQSRQFNVPYGHTTGTFPKPLEFRRFGSLLRRARLISCDFERSLELASAGDLVYVDPPYYAEGRRFRGEYGYGAFSVDDEVRLVKALFAASKRGAAIIVSYNGSLLKSLPGWRAVRQKVTRNVGGFASSRRRVFEYLYTNIPIA